MPSVPLITSNNDNVQQPPLKNVGHLGSNIVKSLSEDKSTKGKIPEKSSLVQSSSLADKKVSQNTAAGKVFGKFDNLFKERVQGVDSSKSTPPPSTTTAKTDSGNKAPEGQGASSGAQKVGADKAGKPPAPKAGEKAEVAGVKKGAKVKNIKKPPKLEKGNCYLREHDSERNVNVYKHADYSDIDKPNFVVVHKKKKKHFEHKEGFDVHEDCPNVLAADEPHTPEEEKLFADIEKKRQQGKTIHKSLSEEKWAEFTAAVHTYVEAMKAAADKAEAERAEAEKAKAERRAKEAEGHSLQGEKRLEGNAATSAKEALKEEAKKVDAESLAKKREAAAQSREQHETELSIEVERSKKLLLGPAKHGVASLSCAQC